MRCNRAREWLSLELDGQLPPDKTFSLDEHLERCEDCRAYRADVQLGHRLLQVTEPQLSENFEWRLQLKLNQTLQEVAQQAALPWNEPASDLRIWLRNFGLSAAAGVAAVALLAFLVLPSLQSTPPANGTGTLTPTLAELTHEESGSQLSQVEPVANALDRRPLFVNQGLQGGVPSGLFVSQQRGRPRVPTAQPQLYVNLHQDSPAQARSSLTSPQHRDLEIILELSNENQLWKERFYQLQREYARLKRQLDTPEELPVDHEDE